MASWEDEDFDVPVASTAALDIEEEDEGLMGGDWEAAADSEEEAAAAEARAKAAAAKPKISSAQRIAERKRKEQEERERKALEKTQEASKEEQHKLEVESDLTNASDLLAAADVHPRAKVAAAKQQQQQQQAAAPPAGPTKLSDLAIFKVRSAKEYTELRKTVAPVLNDLHEKNSATLHTNFIVETCRDLTKPLSSDQVEKVIATLQAVSNAKYREERARRLGARQKPNVKVAASKAPQPAIAPPEELEDDGLDDDDFM